MKVLITGINGFIGRALSEKLTTFSNIEVFGLSKSENENSKITFFKTDVLNNEKVNAIFQENSFDVVCHLAALTAHSDIVDNKYKSLDINLNGTRNLLEAFNKYCVNATFIYTSTGKVYGKTNEMPITEKAIANPTNILGKSKYIAERMIDFYAVPYNKYIITRIFNVFGGSQKKNFIVPTIIDQIKTAGKLTLGNIDDKRDYLYIDDVIDALTGCILKKENFEAFNYVNIGSGIPLSVRDIIREFENVLGKSIYVEQDKGRMRFDETPVEFCDNTKLHSTVGWMPKYTLHNAIEKICAEAGLIKAE
jgi:Nucleoside-diphosphate-sugar epimerases